VDIFVAIFVVKINDDLDLRWTSLLTHTYGTVAKN